MTKDVHFAFEDFKEEEATNSENWMSISDFIRKTSKPQYVALLNTYYKENGVVMAFWNDNDVLVTEEIAKSINELNDRTFNLKRIEQMVADQKADIAREEKRLLQEKVKRLTKEIMEKLTQKGYQPIANACRNLINNWLTDMSKRQPTSQYWWKENEAEVFFNVNSWNIMFEEMDFNPPAIYYRVPVNVTSTTKRGSPIRVTWLVTVLTLNGDDWKILSLSEE